MTGDTTGERQYRAAYVFDQQRRNGTPTPDLSAAESDRAAVLTIKGADAWVEVAEWRRLDSPEPSAVRLSVFQVMCRWRPGSHEWGWEDELRDLRRRDHAAFQALVTSVEAHGLREARDGEEPICLGDDGRVWSGHHRLLAASEVDPRLTLPPGVIFGTGGLNPEPSDAERVEAAHQRMHRLLSAECPRNAWLKAGGRAWLAPSIVCKIEQVAYAALDVEDPAIEGEMPWRAK